MIPNSTQKLINCSESNSGYNYAEGLRRMQQVRFCDIIGLNIFFIQYHIFFNKLQLQNILFLVAPRVMVIVRMFFDTFQMYF